MTETQLQSAILEFARLNGWLCYHTYDSRHSAKGFPDLCMVRGGRMVFAELKSEKGVETDDQKEWGDCLELASIRNQLLEVYLWRQSDWMSGRVDEVLKREGRLMDHIKAYELIGGLCPPP